MGWQQWQTFGVATGTLSIKLRYQPQIKNGTETPGISKAEAIFPIKIK